jgi:hypothetical protein
MPFLKLTLIGRTPWSAADALVGLLTVGYGWCHWAKLPAGAAPPSHNFH